MLERPELADSTVADYVRAAWELAVAELRFMPVGYDPRAWSYEIRTSAGERYFLKVRKGSTDPGAVLVPQFLRDAGIPHVVASIATASGEPWLRAGAYQLLLYPFVIGTTAATAGLTSDQWREFGAFLGALHGAVLPDSLAALVPTETFQCPEAVGTRRLAARIKGQSFSDQVQRELAEFWLDHDAEVAALAERVERLGDLARDQQLPHVLCHADIHGGNIVVDGARGLSIVDWDGPILAPRERDLLFVVGAQMGGHPVTATQQADFAQGYGPVDVNWPALAYYRYERVVEDVFEFAQSVLRTDASEESRRDDLTWLRQQFAPDDAADIARSSERHLTW